MLLAAGFAAALASGTARCGLFAFFVRCRGRLAGAARFAPTFLARRALPSGGARFQIAVGERVLPGKRKIRNGLRRHSFRRRSRCLDDTDRKQIRGQNANACTDRTASTPASKSAATSTHADRSRRGRWHNRLRRFNCCELVADWSRWRSGSDFVIGATPTEIDDIGVVRVLQNAREVALAQALAIASEQLARDNAGLAGANRCTSVRADSAANEVKRFFVTKAEAAGTDLVTGRRFCLGARRRRLRSRLWFGAQGLRCRALTASFALAPSPASPPAARTLGGLALLGCCNTRSVRLCRLLSSGKSADVARRANLELPVFQLCECQQAPMARLGDEARELRHAEVLLVEGAVDLLHYLLESVGAHHVAVARHPLDRFRDELPGILLYDLFFTTLHQTSERVVAVVLVAIHDE